MLDLVADFHAFLHEVLAVLQVLAWKEEYLYLLLLLFHFGVEKLALRIGFASPLRLRTGNDDFDVGCFLSGVGLADGWPLRCKDGRSAAHCSCFFYSIIIVERDRNKLKIGEPSKEETHTK